MITPTIISSLQWKAYLIFMCTNLAFVPLVYYCYPETSNLTLEEVDHIFTRDGHEGRGRGWAAPMQSVQESFRSQAVDVEKPSVEHIDRA